MTDVLQELAESIGRLDRIDSARKLLDAALSQAIPVTEIVERGVRRGLQIVGERYEAGEYFLSELLYTGSLMNDLLDVLRPHMKDARFQRKGLVVLGTVRGDIHDIGKNIFKMLAESTGFEVHDLGVDVESAAFVDEAKQSAPNIIGLSALLTTSLSEMKTTVDAIRAAELRSRILLGGNAVKKDYSNQVGADAAALDAIEGLSICRMWTQK